MVESKDFAQQQQHDEQDDDMAGNESSPPLVPVPAGEPLDGNDIWHLEAVPVPLEEPSAVFAASAPSHAYDVGSAASASSFAEEDTSSSSVPTIVTATREQQQQHHEYVGSSSIPHHNNSASEDDDPERKVTVGAGVASGVIGLLLCGPFLAIILGFGTAYASKAEGAWGDSARAIGNVALKAQEEARRVNEKHHVLERSKQAAQNALAQAQELDRRHRVLDKTGQALRTSSQATRNFIEKHKLVEKSVQGITTFFTWLAKQLEKKFKDHQERQSVGSIAAQTNGVAVHRGMAAEEVSYFHPNRYFS